MKTSSTTHETETGGREPGEPFRGNFAQLCHWAYAVHFKGLRKATANGALSLIRKHAGDPDASPPRLTWLGALDADQVTTAEVEKYLAELAKTRTVRGTWTSAGTIKQLRKLFSGVFKLAIQHGIWSGENPANNGLASHEIGPVLAAAKDWRGVFAVGLLMGLRRGEIFALRKTDVDLERRVLSVGLTECAIPEQLVPHLEAALEALLDKPGRSPLFPDGRGNKRSGHADLAKVLRATMARAGIVAHYDHKCILKGCGHVEQHYDGALRRCPRDRAKLRPVACARKISFDVACRAARAIARAATPMQPDAVIRDAITFTSMKDALEAIDTARTMFAACLPQLSPARHKTIKGLAPEHQRTLEWKLARDLGRGSLDHREVLRQLALWADELADEMLEPPVYRDGDRRWISQEQHIAGLTRLLVDAEPNLLESIEEMLLEKLFERRSPPTRHLRAA